MVEGTEFDAVSRCPDESRGLADDLLSTENNENVTTEDILLQQQLAHGAFLSRPSIPCLLFFM